MDCRTWQAGVGEEGEPAFLSRNPMKTLPDDFCLDANRTSGLRENAREKLSYLYLVWASDPSNISQQEDFLTNAIQALKREVVYNACSKGLCPSFLAPATFAEDAFSLALQKFWTGLHNVEEPSKFAGWLSVVAHSAVVEELLSWRRRTRDGANKWEPLERDYPGEFDEYSGR
jgi:hypothetical protein